MTTTAPARSDRVTAIILIGCGLLGLWASFSLTMDKLRITADPQADLGCDFSVLVQCGTNLLSDQGEIFGFPNPLLGLTGFVAPVVVGAALLARARFAPWFWWLFSAGVTAGLAFVVWLIWQSIQVLGVLCPWCMVVWAVTIVLFWTVLARGAVAGVWGRRLQRPDALWWVIPAVLASYLIVAVWAQLGLDVLGSL